MLSAKVTMVAMSGSVEGALCRTPVVMASNVRMMIRIACSVGVNGDGVG